MSKEEPQEQASPLEEAANAARVRAALRYAGVLASILIVSLGLQLVVEAFNAHALQLDDYWGHIRGLQPIIIVVGTAVIASVGLITYALAASLALALFVQVGVTLLFSFGHTQKMLIRQEPLLPYDLGFLGQIDFLFLNLSPTAQAQFLAGVGFALVSTIIFILYGIMRFRKRIRTGAKERTLLPPAAVIALRAVLGTVGIVTFALAVNFNQPGNVLKDLLADQGVRQNAWIQTHNVRENGALLGFLMNTPGPHMATPDQYSEQSIAQAYERWAEAGRSANVSEGRTA